MPLLLYFNAPSSLLIQSDSWLAFEMTIINICLEKCKYVRIVGGGEEGEEKASRSVEVAVL